MDSFVQKLVRRLCDPSRPLSRNRHFHTFATPEGKLALRTSRRLKSLQRDILACRAEGHRVQIVPPSQKGDDLRVELVLKRIHGSRVCLLEPAELELLKELPGVREALEQSEERASA
jgi:hypothetical protein